MIKTFEQFVYQEKEFLKEILSCDSWDIESTNEEYRFEYYHRTRKPDIKIDSIYGRKMKEIENTLEDYIDNEINPEFIGEYIDEQGVKRTMKFELQSTEHWYEKFFRKEIEDPENKTKIQNPGLYEGITLLYNNRDLLTRYFSNGTLKSDISVTVKTSDFSMYSEIIKTQKLKPNLYKLTLTSQIKGVDFDVKTDKTIKFHPNGPKK